MELKDLMKSKMSGQLGSNPGAFYEGADGKTRYVKHYFNPLQANVEHMANKIYGPAAPETHLFPHEEGVAFASEFIPNKGQITLNPKPELARKVFETGFVPDVMLSNHDVIGLHGDNIVVDDKDDVHRIDNGGSMMFRAQNGFKPDHVLDEVGEWDNFMNRGERPTKYGKFFEIAGYKSPEDLIAPLIEQYNRIDDLKGKYGHWGNFVEDNSVNINSEQKARITKILEHRQRLVKQKIDALIQSGGKVLNAGNKTASKPAYVHFYEELKKVGKSIDHCGDYGYLFVKGKKVWWVCGDADETEDIEEAKRKLRSVKGVEEVIVESEYCPPQKENWEKLI